MTQDDTGDRPYNALDAEYMGQEDYRDGKLAASQEVFERRARGIAGLRHLGIATDMSTLYLAYQCGYEGHCG